MTDDPSTIRLAIRPDMPLLLSAYCPGCAGVQDTFTGLQGPEV